MITFSKFGSRNRLGNQLFQAAFITYFAEIHNLEYALPPWPHAEHFGYKFKFRGDLNELQYDLHVSEPSLGYHQSHFERFLPWIRKGKVNIKTGFFQSYKYFTKKHAKKVFATKTPVTFSVNLGKSVAVHIRRGDFVSHPYYNNIECTTIAELLNRHFQGFKVFVFSDDYKYCRQHFIGKEFVFLEGHTEFEHLGIIRQFENFIVSNSTFSYWGPMLSANPQRVYYPKYMFPDLELCALYNKEYWPPTSEYISYDNPINKPKISIKR